MTANTPVLATDWSRFPERVIRNAFVEEWGERTGPSSLRGPSSLAGRRRSERRCPGSCV